LVRRLTSSCRMPADTKAATESQRTDSKCAPLEGATHLAQPPAEVVTMLAEGRAVAAEEAEPSDRAPPEMMPGSLSCR
jgi:hypothetical protein